MIHDYFIRKNLRDGSPNRRYYKVLYTAALRFGVVLPFDREGISVEFNGQETSDVEAHKNNRALKGTLTLAGKKFHDVVVIDQPGLPGRHPSIRTFWPVSQHPDAHESYTDPLVDTAIDGTPYDITTVATVMHERFKANAGVSPATLMKVLYELETELLRNGAERIGQLLEEANLREKEAVDLAEETIQMLRLESEQLAYEKMERQKAQKESMQKDTEIVRLQKLVYLKPPPGTTVTKSNRAILEKVSEGTRGRYGQKAILLHMSDGTIRANNWSDGYQSRLILAQKLVGHNVSTEVWKNFPWQDWYQNIYPVD